MARYHIPTLMREVEQAMKQGKPIPDTHIRILDAWWETRGKFIR